MNTVSEADKKTFEELLSRDGFLIFMHRSPDGDTIGTALALRRLLLNRGKRVTVACSDEIPRRLRFMTGGQTVFEPEFEPETLVCVDIATPQLLGERYEEKAASVDFCIDHHYTNTGYAKKTVLGSDASSAGEVLYTLMSACGCEIDGEIAKDLYSAISFDTGCFKFSNTHPSTHTAAAALLGYGFDSADINRQLFDVAPMSQLNLEKTAIDNIRLFFDGKVALCCITQEMMKKLGLADGETDGLTNVVRRIEGAVVSVTMRQMSDGKIRVSLRSECDFNVASVAAVFGGGGHVRAAGCSLSGDTEKAAQALVDAIKTEWKKTYDK